MLCKKRADTEVSIDNRFGWSLTTSYSNQHFAIKRLLKKHWGVLKNDRVFCPALPEQPAVIHKDEPALQHKVAPNVIDPPKKLFQKVSFSVYERLLPRHKCNICQINSFRGRCCLSFQSTQRKITYDINTFITRTLKYIIYMISCPYVKQYIGRTKCELQARLPEHVANNKQGFMSHNLSGHYAKYPGGVIIWFGDRLDFLHEVLYPLRLEHQLGHKLFY